MSMRPLVVANWKMQLDSASSVALAQTLVQQSTPVVELVCCPSFPALSAVAHVLRGSPVVLGAQDCAWEERGALTGAVSPIDLQAIGCAFVILGHSERRQQFGETDAMIARKMRAAFAASLIPILCIGETAEEFRAGERAEVIDRQLRVVLRSGITTTSALCIAYEPVWAISGTGHAAMPEDIRDAHARIAALVSDHLPSTVVRILYGGSVAAENLRAILALPNVHGVLVGSASQHASTLLPLLSVIDS